MQDTLWYILGALGVIVLYFTSHVWSELAYIALKHWKETCFIAFCAFAGIFLGFYHGTLDRVSTRLAYAMEMKILLPADEKLAAQISDCKAFVQAKAQGLPYGDEETTRPGIMLAGGPSKWESCARTFGMNYWKHDISIDGRNGGQLLCEAYARQNTPSPNVQVWCETVFAPGQKL